MAGYSLIYGRTFKVGDRVKINDVVGDVTEIHVWPRGRIVRFIRSHGMAVPRDSARSTFRPPSMV